MAERGEFAWFEDVLTASTERLNRAEKNRDAPVWWMNGEVLSANQVTERIRGSASRAGGAS